MSICLFVYLIAPYLATHAHLITATRIAPFKSSTINRKTYHHIPSSNHMLQCNAAQFDILTIFPFKSSFIGSFYCYVWLRETARTQMSINMYIYIYIHTSIDKQPYLSTYIYTNTMRQTQTHTHNYVHMCNDKFK